MRSFLEDLLFGARLLRQNPGFTLIAVVTLALGIGVNTTVFSWIDNVLLRPFPGVAQPDRLALLETHFAGGPAQSQISFIDYLDYRDNLKQASAIAIARHTPLSLGADGRPRRAWGELVSSNYFDVLGVRPILGRGFTAAESSAQPGASPVVVLSYALWHEMFHNDPGVIGRTLRVNRHELTIVGVAPPGFHGTMAGLDYELWAPINLAPLMGTGSGTLTYRATRDLTLMAARLKPGATVEQLNAEADALSQRLAAAYPRTNRCISTSAVPLSQGASGAQMLLRTPLQILAAAAVLMLLLVCANVANLLLARGLGRQRELAVRLALGARPARIVRQLLTETALLGVGGAVLGCVLAAWMSQSLGALLPPLDVPLRLNMELDARALSFTVLVTLAATFACGLLPAVMSARGSLREAAGNGARLGGSRQTHALRGALVVTEVALASIALVGAGLFLRSFRNATQLDPGFDERGVTVSSYYLSASGYTGPEQREFCRQLRARMETVPGVVAVNYSDQVPLSAGPMPVHELKIPGYAARPDEDMHVQRMFVAPGFPALMGIRLLEGRDFTEADEPGKPRVITVNQSFARRYFGNSPAIGHSVTVENAPMTVVGVVADSKYNRLTEPATPFFYAPFRQNFAPGLNFNVYIKAAGNPVGIAEALRRESLALNRDAVFSTTTLAQATMLSLYPLRVAATLMSVLGLVALALAALGLYGVLSYAVRQRTRELGIRIAVGAAPVQLLRLVLTQGLTLAVTGLAVGLAGAAALARLAGSMLVHIGAHDTAVYGVTALFLITVALLATLAPARRAVRIDPIEALRSE